MIDAEASKKPMLSLVGIRREKGVDQKLSHLPLPILDSITDTLRAEYGLVMTSCIRSWYHRYQEEKKMLIGHLEKSFNDLLDIKSVIGIKTKDGRRENYVGTI